MGVCRLSLHCLDRYIPIGQSFQMSNRLNARATSTPSMRWQKSNSQETKNSSIINHRHYVDLQSTRATSHNTKHTLRDYYISASWEKQWPAQWLTTCFMPRWIPLSQSLNCGLSRGIVTGDWTWTYLGHFSPAVSHLSNIQKSSRSFFIRSRPRLLLNYKMVT